MYSINYSVCSYTQCIEEKFSYFEICEFVHHTVYISHRITFFITAGFQYLET
jgi:hypothetical protein